MTCGVRSLAPGTWAFDVADTKQKAIPNKTHEEMKEHLQDLGRKWMKDPNLNMHVHQRAQIENFNGYCSHPPPNAL